MIGRIRFCNKLSKGGLLKTACYLLRWPLSRNVIGYNLWVCLTVLANQRLWGLAISYLGPSKQLQWTDTGRQQSLSSQMMSRDLERSRRILHWEFILFTNNPFPEKNHKNASKVHKNENRTALLVLLLLTVNWKQSSLNGKQLPEGDRTTWLKLPNHPIDSPVHVSTLRNIWQAVKRPILPSTISNYVSDITRGSTVHAIGISEELYKYFLSVFNSRLIFAYKPFLIRF